MSASEFQAVLDNAVDMFDMWFGRAFVTDDLKGRRDTSHVHVRVAIEERLFRELAQMQDPVVRRHWEVETHKRLMKLFGTCRDLPREKVTVLPPNLARKPRGAAASSVLARKDHGKLIDLPSLLEAGAAQQRVAQEPEVLIVHPFKNK